MNKRTTLALYIALSATLGAVEVLVLPVNVIPGVKLGIANLVTLVALYQFDFKSAIIVSSFRVIIVSLIIGTLFSPSFFISLAGMFVSLICLYVAFKSNLFSIIGVSVLASVGHIIGQVIMVTIILNSNSMFAIMPFLIYISILTGCVNGWIAKRILKIVSKNAEVKHEF